MSLRAKSNHTQWIMWFLLIAVAARAAIPSGLMLSGSMSGESNQQGPLAFCPGHAGSAELISALDIEEDNSHYTDSGTQFCSFSSSGLNHGLDLAQSDLDSLFTNDTSISANPILSVPLRSYQLLPSRAPPQRS